MLGVAVTAGWLWLGNAGAALLGLWIWANHWPEYRGGTRRLCIALEDLRTVRLGAYRVLLVRGGFQTAEIFVDELAPAEFARLRRELKRWFRARGDRRSRD